MTLIFAQVTSPVTWDQLETSWAYAGEETPPLVEALEGVHGQEVQVRGFLYETEDNRLLLAAEPNLKSCCVGKTDLAGRQMIVDGPSLDGGSSGAVTMEGTFFVDVARDESGQARSVYHLTNAHIIAEPDSVPVSTLIFLGAFLIVVASGAVVLWRRARA